jgi:hypothetical protein
MVGVGVGVGVGLGVGVDGWHTYDSYIRLYVYTYMQILETQTLHAKSQTLKRRVREQRTRITRTRRIKQDKT